MKYSLIVVILLVSLFGFGCADDNLTLVPKPELRGTTKVDDWGCPAKGKHNGWHGGHATCDLDKGFHWKDGLRLEAEPGAPNDSVEVPPGFTVPPGITLTDESQDRDFGQTQSMTPPHRADSQ
jgi:hypothetical protein